MECLDHHDGRDNWISCLIPMYSDGQWVYDRVALCHFLLTDTMEVGWSPNVFVNHSNQDHSNQDDCQVLLPLRFLTSVSESKAIKMK